MSNHPNRSKRSSSEAANPALEDVLAARIQVGQSVETAAAVIYVPSSQWEDFERPKDAPGHRRMHPGLFELYRIKTGLMEVVRVGADASVATEVLSKTISDSPTPVATWREPQGDIEWWSGYYGFALHAIRGDGRWVRESGEKAGVVRAVCGIVVPDDFRCQVDGRLRRCGKCENAINAEAR